ncbi:MAG TPA: SDR family oxidoreductase [Burkholderiales bacterium]
MTSTKAGFEGRVAVVVGAGQSPSDVPNLVGNGRAIALTLSRAGAVVVCVDRDRAAAEATLAFVESEGGSGHAVQADIAIPEDARSLVDEAISRYGRIDHLVLNAGISDRRPLAEVTAESWDAIFAVNLRGHMLCAEHALPRMSNGGSIVFVSSVAAFLPAARNPAYEASKAALGALCRAVALEGHPRSIRANVVYAGLIDTPMGRAAGRARPERARGPLPFGRQGTAWEVANAVRFLLSDDASYVNATGLVVDGGLSNGVVLNPTNGRG